MSGEDRKRYKHGDDHSADYIDGLISGAPKRSNPYEQMDTSTNFVPRDGWTSEVYSRLDGGERKDPNHGCFSCTVLLFSILLSLAGLGLIALAVIQNKQNILPLCPDCHTIIIGLYGAGGFVLAIGILGVVSAVLRMKVVAIPFSIIITIIGLVFLAAAVGVYIVESQLDPSQLVSVWESTITADPTAICDVQSHFSCSGYSLGCCTTAFINISTFVFPNTTASVVNNTCYYTSNSDHTYYSVNGSVITWPKSVCVTSGCATNNYTTTCDTQLVNDLKDVALPIVASVGPFGLLSIIVGVLSICMTRKKGPCR